MPIKTPHLLSCLELKNNNLELFASFIYHVEGGEDSYRVGKTLKAHSYH